ncbi:hypothetical protein PO909_002292 [Leuciscus waleckii]
MAKRSTRIAGSGEKPRRLRKHLQRDESSLKSLAAPPSTLRTRLAYFTETAPPPAVVPRRKKRRAQRVPEPSPTRQSSPVRPPASPASSVSLPDGQWPPSAAASIDDADEKAALGEDDSCSLLASGSEDWASSVDLAPSVHASSGKRASIESELMRVLAQAAASLERMLEIC